MSEETKPKKASDPTVSALKRINNVLKNLTPVQRKAVLAYFQAQQE